tara:strand:+ start:253 stop:483 length:231 start_codon:yes stop_codon:yes gene_type:complete
MLDVTKVDVEAAIAFIEMSKWTHELWVGYLGEIGDDAMPAEPQPYSVTAGNTEHHHRCVSEYEHVLAVLNELLGTV